MTTNHGEKWIDFKGELQETLCCFLLTYSDFLSKGLFVQVWDIEKADVDSSRHSSLKNRPLSPTLEDENSPKSCDTQQDIILRELFHRPSSMSHLIHKIFRPAHLPNQCHPGPCCWYLAGYCAGA